MKKFILFGSLMFLLSSLFVNPIEIKANELDECLKEVPTSVLQSSNETVVKPFGDPSDPVSETVDVTVSDLMSQGGCWASVSFHIRGSYTYAYLSSRYVLLGQNISVSIVNAPSDWTVVIDSVEYELTSALKCLVKIRYHYKASTYDCAFAGGYQYTMKSVAV